MTHQRKTPFASLVLDSAHVSKPTDDVDVIDVHLTPVVYKAYKLLFHIITVCPLTVNMKIFTRVLFSRNFTDVEFRENKTLAKWQNHSGVY